MWYTTPMTSRFAWKTKREEVSDPILALLENRGVKPEDQEAFFTMDWSRDLHDPDLFTKMGLAVARVFKALEGGEKIVVHGDYDADGVCGSSVLTLALRDIARTLSFDLHLDVFLPDREKDGYGVARHTIARFGEEGVNLLITVDCGIANANEFDLAKELGIDVIICDHHQLGERLPEHALILHPLAPGEEYPNKKLCGTGVAYKFATALIREARARGAELPEGYEKWFVDFVAIATVTDVMPILGENRVLEHFGLKVLKKTKWPGLRALLQMSRADGTINTQTIGFQIGPRINAAGRVKHAKHAFEALTAKTEEEAREHVELLETLNRERKKISDVAYREAKAKVENEQSKKPAIIVWEEHWHPGVIGLAAGKLVQDFGLPTFVLAKVGKNYVGSGRTAGGLHLVEAMKSCGDIFVKFGGHPQACGLTIAQEHLQTFKQGVETFAESFFGNEQPKPSLEIDFELPLEIVTPEFFIELQRFEPFGEGNREPVFVMRGAKVANSGKIGSDGKHLRLSLLTKTGKLWKGVGFGFGDLESQLTPGTTIDLVYRIQVNEWNGRSELQFELIDLML